MTESIAIVCPDVNIKLWATRTGEAAIGGGKSAILQLASAWARASHSVTIACPSVVEGQSGDLRICNLSQAAGTYDVVIYVTGSLGHFNLPEISEIEGSVRLLWMNSPNRVELPPGPAPDWFIAPARFLARRAIDEWGFPSERVVYIPGEAVTRLPSGGQSVTRDEFAIIYASHPFKGLDNTIEVIERVRGDYPKVRLDVYGSAKLHGDVLDASLSDHYPQWVRIMGAVPQREVEQAMHGYGAMLYLTNYIDGFSLATAEALAAGVLVIATAHGSQAEFVQHGWNGFLISSNQQLEPDLNQAEELLRHYLADPPAFGDLRARARASVPSWDEQAGRWQRAWRASKTGAPVD